MSTRLLLAAIGLMIGCWVSVLIVAALALGAW
jgi:hypothetical protein